MTNIIRIAAMLGVAFIATTAQAAVSNRAECYDVVIAHCNATAGDNAQKCAKNGMDQCDAQFKKIALPEPGRVTTLKAD
jgi:hypothetical protein